MSLSRDPAFSYLKDRFVLGYRDITGLPYAGLSGHHDQDQGSTDTTNGSGNRNVQLFVLAPDGTVLHCLPGYWNPHDLVHELELAEHVAAIWQGPGAFADKQDRFHRLQLDHITRHPEQMTRRSEIQSFDRFTEMARSERATGRDPSTVTRLPDGTTGLKTTDVIVHERMALRPFLPFAEFDVAAFVDYGGTYYDKHTDHDRSLGAGSGSSRAQAAAGDHRMVAQPGPFALTLSGITGGQIAILTFAGTQYIVRPGDTVPDTAEPAFTVKSITRDRVTVRATLTNEDLTVTLGDEPALARR